MPSEEMANPLTPSQIDVISRVQPDLHLKRQQFLDIASYLINFSIYLKRLAQLAMKASLPCGPL